MDRATQGQAMGSSRFLKGIFLQEFGFDKLHHKQITSDDNSEEDKEKRWWSYETKELRQWGERQEDCKSYNTKRSKGQ